MSAPMPSACTEISPQWSGPSAVSSPGLSAMNVAVALARSSARCATPVSASRPLGTSSARIGAPLAFAQSTQFAWACSQRTRQPDAEQAVDDECRPPGRGGREPFRAGRAQAPARRFCIGWKRRDLAGRDDMDVDAALAQPSRDDVRIAAIVARTGEDDDRPALGSEHRGGDFGRSGAGALHQRLVRVAPFDGAQRRNGQDRRQGHRVGNCDRDPGIARKPVCHGTPAAPWTIESAPRRIVRSQAAASGAGRTDKNIQGVTPMRKLELPLLLAALALVAAPVFAQDTGTLKKIKDTGTITIGYRESSIPFSYLDDKQQPIGYAMDICMKVVDAVKAELKMPNLKVALQRR